MVHIISPCHQNIPYKNTPQLHMIYNAPPLVLLCWNYTHLPYLQMYEVALTLKLSSFKVNVINSLFDLKWTPLYERWIIECEFKNKHQINMC